MFQYKQNPFKVDYGNLPDYLRPVYRALLTNPYRNGEVSPGQFRKITDKALLTMQARGEVPAAWILNR